MADFGQIMILRSLDDHFKIQTHERRVDPKALGCIPVGYVLDPTNEVDFESFVKRIGYLGGTVESITTPHLPASVTISYPNRPPELWVHSKEDNYKKLYLDFCRSILNVELTGSFRYSGFAVDHSYSRGSVPVDVNAYIRLFLVKAGPNSSWGAQYERRLNDLFVLRNRAGMRKETVAIRAKLSGIRAPRKGFRNSRNLQNVAEVVNSLINLGMTSRDDFKTDFDTLVNFCGMVDGLSTGMITHIDGEGNTYTAPF